MPLVPGDRIGIIGGGQLGRMLAMAAARLGFHITVLDPSDTAPAFEVSDAQIIAPYSDKSALKALHEQCDVVTYEFENVDVNALEANREVTPCYPGTRALAVSQDRLIEKQFFVDAGAKTADFHEVSNVENLHSALEKTSGNGILKTRRFGYDGKGQIRIADFDQIAINEATALVESSACILESFIRFEREVSIIVARSTNGDIAAYDLAENVHKDGILATSTVPSKLSEATVREAHKVAGVVLEKLDYVGVLAIEFFVIGDGELVVNEFAPRVHNSGHWTEAACLVSQFEQHIRAIAGLPLGSIYRHSDCVMENLIGNQVNTYPEVLQSSDSMLHLYGKAETREGRKMGHFTRLKPM